MVCFIDSKGFAYQEKINNPITIKELNDPEKWNCEIRSFIVKDDLCICGKHLNPNKLELEILN
jgi:hypothetical protein